MEDSSDELRHKVHRIRQKHLTSERTRRAYEHGKQAFTENSMASEHLLLR